VPVLSRQLFLGACSLTIAVVGTIVASAGTVGNAGGRTEGRRSFGTATGQAAPRPATAPLQTLRSMPKTVPVAPHPHAARPAPRTSPRSAKPDPYGRFGFDISWPQCSAAGATLPPPLGPVAIVGINGGRPFSTNPCLRAEWQWARSRRQPGAYLNLAAPMSGDPLAYGAATARDSTARAAADGVRLRSVWLDVEVGNHWSPDAAVNAKVIQGAIGALQAVGVAVGVYSTPLDWRRITHEALLTIPVWQAIADGRQIAQGCSSSGFGGRSPDLVQAVFTAPDGHEVDGNLICTSRPDFLRVLG
jgi:hypothetical protein